MIHLGLDELTMSGLRRYTATTTRQLNQGDTEKTAQMAHHMGHTLNTHM